jgi:P-type E1-E2 ATPase
MPSAALVSSAALALVRGHDRGEEFAVLAAGALGWAGLSALATRRLRAATSTGLAALRAAHDGTNRRVNESGVEVATAGELRVGEEVLLGPEERLLADGVVTDGSGSVELFLGATQPSVVTRGHRLPAGSRVLEGELRVVCTRTGEGALFRRLLDSGPAATERAPLASRLAASAATVGAPSVAVFVGLVTYWLTGAPLESIVSAAALLSALAHPLLPELPRAVARKWLLALSRQGVHLEPEALDASAQVTLCVFCARGTVLSGEPEVAEIETFRDLSEAEVLALAAGAESVVDHPAASAVLRAAHARAVGPDVTRGHEVLAGQGVVCITADGRSLVVGNRELLLAQRISIARAEESLRRLETRGRAGLLVAVDGHLAGVIALYDGLRPGARAAVQLLLDEGIEPVLLSGDARLTTETVARALSIEHVRPEVPAAARGSEVSALAAGGASVAVLGHSPLDDGALRASTVPLVLEGATSSMLRSGFTVLGADVRVAVRSLLSARRLHDEAQRALALALGPPALLGVATASQVLPPLAAPLASALGAGSAALLVWLRRRDCSPGRPYGTPDR